MAVPDDVSGALLLRAIEIKAAAVKKVEVSPRDGLQNEKQVIDVNTRISFIEKLVAAGVRKIEATSFVSLKWAP